VEQTFKLISFITLSVISIALSSVVYRLAIKCRRRVDNQVAVSRCKW